MYPSWWKNRTLSHFSKPNFDMPCPNWKSYKVNGDPQFFIFLLVQKNIYSLSPLCTRSLTSVTAEIWFFKSLDRGCRTKGPLPNLGRLTVVVTERSSNYHHLALCVYQLIEAGGWGTLERIVILHGYVLGTHKAVNREDKLSRRYRGRDLAKFERSRRYRER